jgi:deoxycytidylate deaminase
MYLTLHLDQTKTCNEKQELFLKRAANIAARSPVRCHRHGCIIVNKDNEVVAEGYNHHAIQFEHKFTVHAEIDALMKMKKNKRIISECAMYVVRIGTDHMGKPLKYSRPCADCTRAILKSGIKRVYFSTDHEFQRAFSKLKEEETLGNLDQNQNEDLPS